MSIEVQGLDNFQRNLLRLATRTLPRESLKIMRKMGGRARTIAAKNSRSEVGKVTGKYRKGWKVGKSFRRGGEFMVYVKNVSPHAHLIEKGHRIVGPDGTEHGFKEGLHILENSMKQFEETEMETMLGEWLDQLLSEGL
ncbi:HK97 gp10 family phage protein [Cohnella cholangitidis]|uniref:HK97 gp10 family phage protein n=1 Tax=Cohnella cholangitidis TaxID=2598458 RepID=A0A7G5C3F5_9BACL|nr:HK97 gp10 family phage protein [Cohnella cholangitidis]QMV43739.1 HK97 gp10 family phage protein [Cohnella cholangitidis]